jgi:RNA recognition motif-containing protein
VVYTDVGEKARPTPYIKEIKARKFERKSKNKLFVGGLTFEATRDFLYDQFDKYGEIDDG